MTDAAPCTDDEFASWLEHPVTKWMRATAAGLADDRRAAWLEASWGTGKAPEGLLMQLRGQADAHLWFADIEYSAACEAAGQDPVFDSREP